MPGNGGIREKRGVDGGGLACSSLEPIRGRPGEEFLQRDASRSDDEHLRAGITLAETCQALDSARSPGLHLQCPGFLSAAHDKIDLLRAVAPVGNGIGFPGQLIEKVKAHGILHEASPPRPISTRCRDQRRIVKFYSMIE